MLTQIKKLFQSKATSASDSNPILINAYCTKGVVSEPVFPHTFHHRRDLSDPDLFEHLSGFASYVSSRGNDEMSRAKYHVIRHIERTQHHLSFTVEENQMDVVANWAENANALLFFPDGNVLDTKGRILVSAIDGDSDLEAQIPYPIEAWNRKARTEQFLATKNLKVPQHLPPLISETEYRPRDAKEVMGRALALFVVTLRAEQIGSDDPFPIPEIQKKFPLAFNFITENEREFLFAENPTEHDAIQFIWRYECLNLLEWALGLVDELSFPNTICDVPMAAKLMALPDQNTLLESATLRSAVEILDALDLNYRLHWLVRQAQHNQADMPPDCEVGVIAERHYALNWLVRFEDSDWDNVNTPT